MQIAFNYDSSLVRAVLPSILDSPRILMGAGTPFIKREGLDGIRAIHRLRSKYDMVISAAGGVDLKEARSAIFNGANIVVVNLVAPGDPWEGISTDSDVGAMAKTFLDTIE